VRRASGVRKSGVLDALEALFEAEWSRGAEIAVSAGEIGEIAPDAIDDVDAQLLSLLLAGLNDKSRGLPARDLAANGSAAGEPPHGPRARGDANAARLAGRSTRLVSFLVGHFARRRLCCPY